MRLIGRLSKVSRILSAEMPWAWIPGRRKWYCKRKKRIRKDVYKRQPITIEEGAWLAARVTVCPGVTIGKGAVIGTGSVVTKDIPAGMLAVGTPCKPLRPVK